MLFYQRNIPLCCGRTGEILICIFAAYILLSDAGAGGRIEPEPDDAIMRQCDAIMRHVPGVLNTCHEWHRVITSTFNI